jgi:hypothetical protein
MSEKEILDDRFLKALIKSDGIKSPSRDFTKNIMARIPKREVIAKESSRIIGKNLTLSIFMLIGLLNAIILYFVWPYLSVWIPENSFFLFVLDNIKILIKSHMMTVIHRSTTISLLLIITLGSITIIGKDEIIDLFQKTNRKAAS